MPVAGNHRCSNPAIRFATGIQQDPLMFLSRSSHMGRHWWRQAVPWNPAMGQEISAAGECRSDLIMIPVPSPQSSANLCTKPNFLQMLRHNPSTAVLSTCNSHLITLIHFPSCLCAQLGFPNHREIPHVPTRYLLFRQAPKM